MPGPAGNPETFYDHDYGTAYSYGFYVQDEWKITKALTLNYGGRFDIYQSSHIRQNQLNRVQLQSVRRRVGRIFAIDEDAAEP